MTQQVRPSFSERSLSAHTYSDQFLRELFYLLPDDLIHLPYTLPKLWRIASACVSVTAKRDDLDRFINYVCKQEEIKSHPEIKRHLEAFKREVQIPYDESLLRLRLFIGRVKRRLLRVLSRLDIVVIERLQKHFPKKEIPLFLGEQFFVELQLFKGLREAQMLPPGPERTQLQGALFQIAMWDGFTRYAVKAMRDLTAPEMKMIFLDYVNSLYNAQTSDGLEQALIFIDLLLSDERIPADLKRGALMEGVENSFKLERGDLAYLFASILERDNQPHIHVLNLRTQINQGEVERSLDYYDAMIPEHEEMIEEFFNFDLSVSLRLVEEIASRCDGLSNGPLRDRCVGKLVRQYILHKEVETALELLCDLPSGEQRDSILEFTCSLLLARKNLDEILPFLHLLTSPKRREIIEKFEEILSLDQKPEWKEKLEKLKIT